MDVSEFDYVVVGSGSAGSVMGGRLSENPETSVAVLEAGGETTQWYVKVPLGVILMIPSKRNNWAFDTMPQKGMNGRVGYQPRGKGLGGSTVINGMVYMRGNRWDYDHWASLGNEGWSYEDVLPYFLRSEHNERINDEYHGQGGPLNVADPRTDNPLYLTYIDAMQKAGLPLNTDFNGVTQDGVGLCQVTMKDGERWSAARAFLLPHMGVRKNLAVMTGAHVNRVLFDGKRAIGVEFEREGKVQRVMARKEVILSAGAIQSPHLLMLSGVGPAAQLRAHNIPVVHDLPGVGENLQDHPDVALVYRTKSSDTYGVSVKGVWRLLREILRYRKIRRGMIASNIAESSGFIRTDPDLPAPDIQMGFIAAILDNHGRTLHRGHGYSSHVILLRPKSRGKIYIRSADPRVPPDIDPAFLENPDDIEVMLKGFKMVRELDRAPGMDEVRGEEMFTANIRTDDDIREMLKQRVDTIYHPVGTCKMGDDAMAVVDNQLRVRGIEGLRVADASIMPTIIGGNTSAPTMMIAEKASDMILGRQ
jgi:choline dehydrogenase-like flavoprotein